LQHAKINQLKNILEFRIWITRKKVFYSHVPPYFGQWILWLQAV
jgi:hypothetical protein